MLVGLLVNNDSACENFSLGQCFAFVGCKESSPEI